MTFLATGFVDGGSVTAEMLRRSLYAGTVGNAGVVLSGDLKVAALSTPGGSVTIAAGTGIVPTKFSGAYAAQSYIVANDASYTLTVPTNSSGSTITRYVILRITDPQYAGEPVPGSPATAIYVVPELVSALPTTKPYLHLATLTLPNGTSAVTSAMIADKRDLVNPRRRRDPRALNVSSSQSLSSTSLIIWPSSATWTYSVPSWATEAVVMALLGGVYSPSAQANASVQVRIGTGRADVILVNAVQIDSDGSGNGSRTTIVCAGKVSIPSTMQGVDITVDIIAKKNSGASTIKVDTASNVFLDIDFAEATI